MEPTTARRYGYWITTALLALAFAVGGSADLAGSEPVRATLAHLGYPPYVALLLGTWKLLGALAIIVPERPLLKEWAYAGMFFDLTGAFASHLALGDAVPATAPSAVLVGLLIASYTLRPSDRRLLDRTPSPSDPREEQRSRAILARGSSVMLITGLSTTACSLAVPPSSAPEVEREARKEASTPHPVVAREAAEVVTFWREAGPSLWFAKDPAFDRRFRERFLSLHEAATRGVLDSWQTTPEGSLALLILLDQFPRNAFRGTPRMYASDEIARRVADTVLAAGHDRAIDAALRLFLYLPFGHSENLADQERSVRLSEGLGEPSLTHAKHHHDIIRRFGRFPHRNAILGRESTKEEVRYLAEGGFAG